MRRKEDFVRVGLSDRGVIRFVVQLTSRGRVQDSGSVRLTQPLKGTQLDAKELRNQEDLACCGGMCRASSSVARLLFSVAAWKAHRCTTPVRRVSWKQWAARAEDPGMGAVGWSKHGALAGISESPVLPGIFPTVDVESDFYLGPLLLDHEVDRIH